MKFLSSQLTYLLTEKETRRNLQALLKFVLFLGFVIFIFSVAFHWIMLEVEGRSFSWITGFYWTLTVMSTLGFGDITPKTPQAAALVTVQAIAGQMYLAVLVARLVSLQITNPTEPEASP